MSELKSNRGEKLWPLTLLAAVILLDQITKALVVRNIPLFNYYSDYEDGSIIPIFGDFLRLIHVRNKAVAFSMGSSLPDTARKVLFAFLPLAVIIGVLVMYFRSREFTKPQRWCICAVLGGGIGNLIDRFFRPEGVVDFIDCIFFGSIRGVNWPVSGPFAWLGMTRWPTFNVADVAVVLGVLAFVVSYIVQSVNDAKERKSA